ncbi:hypothetical protein [Streptomyces blastmyceticus]|uniref:Uncharacterized protein n=1 Tax=Streptomyces blastmyceticus TaxID=68180 RepID=A0ABN0WU71_9ACTN
MTGYQVGVTLGTRRGEAPFTIAEDELPPADRMVSVNSRATAVAWCEDEFENLRAACEQAAESGDPSIAWKLPAALRSFFQLSRPTVDWVTVSERALAVAEALQDERAQLVAVRDLTSANHYSGRYAASYEYGMRALELSQRLRVDEG